MRIHAIATAVVAATVLSGCHQPSPLAADDTASLSRAAESLTPATCSGERPLEETSLVVRAAPSLSCNEAASFAALLTSATGQPLPGREVRFRWGTQVATATSDERGVAGVEMSRPPAAGSYALAVEYDGDEISVATRQDSIIVVERMRPRLILAAPAGLATEQGQMVRARLLTPDARPLAGYSLEFSLGEASHFATTDVEGLAEVTFDLTNEPTGPAPLTVSLPGDGCVEPVHAVSLTTLYAPSSFVVWGGNSSGLGVGDVVNFWGHSWEKQVVDGDHPRQFEFKGYASTSRGMVLCPGDDPPGSRCWSAKPGQSFPPATLPSHIGVLVTTSLEKHAGMVSGNVAAIAVVEVSPTPAYRPVPGKPGHGTVVAVVEPGDVFPATPGVVAEQSQPSVVLPGESFEVHLELSNPTSVDARQVKATQTFIGSTPATASETLSRIAAHEQQAIAFRQTVTPLQPLRGDESPAQYLGRLWSASDSRVSASGLVTIEDGEGHLQAPVLVSSSGHIALPWLNVALKAPAGTSPGVALEYLVRLDNLGSAPASGILATLTLPDGSRRPLSFNEIPAGESQSVSVSWTPPAMPPRAEDESSQAYVARLQQRAAREMKASVEVSWRDARDNDYGPVHRRTTTSEHLPILVATAPSPPPLLPGQSVEVSFELSNVGAAAAHDVRLSLTGENGNDEAGGLLIGCGETVEVSLKAYAGAIDPRATGEPDDAYIARLSSLDGSPLSFEHALAWTDADGHPYGVQVGRLDSNLVLPRLTLALSAPADARPGETVAYQVAVTNQGHAAATHTSVSVALPDGSSVPVHLGRLFGGETAATSIFWTVPVIGARAEDETVTDYVSRLNARSASPLVAIATAHWQDEIDNEYGDLSTEAATSQRVPVLLVTPRTPGSLLPGEATTIGFSIENVGNAEAAGSFLRLEGPDGDVALTGRFRLEPGVATFVEVAARAPALAPRQRDESEAAYLGRLDAVDGSILSFDYVLTWSDDLASEYGAVDGSTKTFEILPRLAVTAAGPRQATPGEVLEYSVLVENLGHANAEAVSLVAHLPDGSARAIEMSSTSLAASSAVVATFTETLDAGRSAGPFVIQVGVTWRDALDSAYGEVSSSVETQIRQPNQPPVVSAAAPLQLTLPAAATLSGTVIDDGLPEEGTLSVWWTQTSGPGTATFADADQETTTVTFTVPGLYQLRLTATDGELFSSTEVTIQALPGNQPPEVTVTGPESVSLADMAWLRGTATDDGQPAGSTLSYEWMQVSGPGSTIFSASRSLETGARFSTPGIYLLRLVASDGELLGSADTAVMVTQPAGTGTTYQPGAEGAGGDTLINLTRTGNQLQLTNEQEPFGFIWVAVSSKGTVVKIDTTTGQVLGEYWTSPAGQPRNPSRTTVDHNGSVWATNRDGNSVVHIGLVENGECVDRNGNGVIDTSTGLDDVRPWTNTAGADTGGGVSTADDECILHYVKVRSSGTRHVSVDSNNDVWVSGTGGRHFDLVDGRTGEIKRQENAVGYGGYGGLIDKNGVIWSASQLLRWDTAKPLTGANGGNWRGYTHASYGLCIDSQGNVWNTSYSGNRIRKFAPNGTLLGTYTHGHTQAQGCVVDKRDHVWVAHAHVGEATVAHLKNNGTLVGKVPVISGVSGVAVDAEGKIWATAYNARKVQRIDPLAGPLGADRVTPVGAVDFTSVDLGGLLYNYSDMTGSTLGGVPDTGTWSAVFDSQRAGAPWGRVSWTSQVSGDGSLTVSASTSADGVTFSAPVVVTNGVDAAIGYGRYVKVSVLFKRSSKGESPVLYDLTVGTTDFMHPSRANEAPRVDAGLDRSVTLGHAVRVTGSATDDGLPAEGRLTVTWTKVSGPGDVVFGSDDREATDVDFSEPGHYVLRLTADDGALSSSDDLALEVLENNQPPTVMAGGAQLVDLGQAATLQGVVSDDGLPAPSSVTVQWSKASGPGNVTFTTPGQALTQARFSAAGVYVLRLTASDGLLSSSADVIVTVSALTPANQPPLLDPGHVVLVSGPSSFAIEGAWATDDGLPSDTLVVQWTSVSGPAAVVFDQPDSLNPSFTVSTPGTYVLRLTASDGELSASRDLKIDFEVSPTTNKPPSVSAGANLAIAMPTNSVFLSGSATDDGLPAGSALVISWSKVSGPGTVEFGTPDARSTSATFAVAGSYVLRISASDGQFTSSAETRVDVYARPPANAAPLVSAGPNRSIALADKTVVLTGSASDDGNPAGGALTVAWSQISGPAAATFAAPTQATTAATFPVVGTYVLRLRASDGELSSSAEVTVTVGPNPARNEAPVVLAGKNRLIELPTNTVALQGSVTDDGLPAGSVLTTQWSVASGPATVMFANASNPATTATFTRPGDYLLRLAANDGELASSSVLWVTVRRDPRNRPPDVDAGIGALVETATLVTLGGSVIDDGLPAHETLSIGWRQLSGPAPVTFADVTNPTSEVLFPVAGDYTLELMASDGEFLLGMDVTYRAQDRKANTPPQVNLSAPSKVTLPASASLSASVHDDGYPNATLSYAWSQVDGPGVMTFGSPTQRTTTASFSDPGTYLVRFTANDGEAVTSKQASIEVVRLNQPPVVNAGASQTLAWPQRLVTLNGMATDDGLPQGSTLQTRWSVVTGAGPVVFADPTQTSTSASFSYPGSYRLRLTASDGDKSASADVIVTVDAPEGPRPTVALENPLDGATVTAPTAVIGSVSGGEWKVEYALGGDDSVSRAWTTIGQGDGIVSSGLLATFDPTLLLNGMYELRLVATTSAGTASAGLSVSVERGMKVGAFTLAFEDLSVPMAGMPIQVVRTYDSRDKRSGDFGVGWNVGIRNVRIEKSGVLGLAWQMTKEGYFAFPTYCVKPSRPTFVTVTFPDDRVYKFQVAPQCQPLVPPSTMDLTFEPVSGTGTHGKLAVAGNATAYVDTRAYGIPGPAVLTEPDLSPYNPRRFVLTVEDGTQFVLEQGSGLRSATDTNGFTVFVERDGLFHSSGKSITFVRDQSERITQIIDPAGAVRTYSYDVAGDLVASTDREGHRTSYTYDARHNLEDIIDPLGVRAVRSDYDDSGRLVSTTDADGNTVEYRHDLARNQEEIVDRLGNHTIYTYDDLGNVTRVEDALGHVTEATFDERGNKLSEVDPLGHETRWTYNILDQQTSETDALGHVTSQTYNSYFKPLTSTDALGGVTTSAYDAQQNMLWVRDPLDQVTSYGYKDGQRIRETDPKGATTSFSHDAYGNVTHLVDALGNVTTTTYDANGRLLSETRTRTKADSTSESLVTRYEYDANGNRTKTIRADGSVETTAYDARGKVASSTDALGRVTSYEHDRRGNLLKTTYPDGTTTSATWDAEGRRTTSTDQLGRVTAFEYDPLGRLVRTTFPDGSTRTSEYDAAGRTVASIDELGHRTEFKYDALGRQIEVKDALGNVTRTSYDATGNVLETTDANGHVTTREYDALGREVRLILADGSVETTEYDEAGNRVAKVDAAGIRTAYGYDDIGRLISVTDALGGVTSYAYDEVGNRISQVNANGHSTLYSYDQMNQEVTRTLADVSSEAHSYDFAGNPITRTRHDGRVIEFEFDTMNRLSLRRYPNGEVQTYTWTPMGRRQSTTDERGTTAYEYDARDRLTSIVMPDGQRLEYEFDQAGRVTSLTAVTGGQSFRMTYQRDALGRIISISDSDGRTYQHFFDDSGNRTERIYPNGITEERRFDVRGRVTRIEGRSSMGNVMWSYDYDLLPTGHRKRVVDADGSRRVWGYDILYRLTSERTETDAETRSEVFEYDAVGNRLSRTVYGQSGSSIEESTYDERDHLISSGANAHSWDADGRLLAQGDLTLSWDDDDRLRQVTMTDGTIVEHWYDADGNRVRTRTRHAGGSANDVNYLVDSSGELSHVVAETDASGALIALHVRDGNELLATVRPDGPRFLHADAIGSVRSVTDAAGGVVARYEYSAFGVETDVVGIDPNEYRFAGEPRDLTTDLAYHRERWLSTSTGRFVSKDWQSTVDEEPSTLHRYIYANANPTTYTDPSGLFTSVGMMMGAGYSGGLRAGSVSALTPILTSARTAVLGVQASLNARPIIMLAMAAATGAVTGSLSDVSERDRRKQEHRGSIQVQGSDIKEWIRREGLAPRRESGFEYFRAVGTLFERKFDGDTMSWAWAQKTPLTASHGKAGLNGLKFRLALSSDQYVSRIEAFRKADRYIDRCRSIGGCSPPGESGFQNSRERQKASDKRVDVVINSGLAFSPR